MNAPRPYVRWPVVAAAVPLLVFVTLVAHETWWGLAGVYHMQPYFADLVAILASGEAGQAGRDVYAWGNPFDPLGRPHCYGPWWLVCGPLGLTTADAAWLGKVLLVGFVSAGAFVLAPRRPATAVVAALLLTAPPVLFCVERANNDLVVFLLFAAAGVLLARTGRGAGFAGASLVGLSAVLKIYPLAALPALGGGQPWPRRQVLLLIGVVLVACELVFWWWLDDYWQALTNVPRPYTLWAYGLRIPVWGWHDRTASLWAQLAASGGVAAVAAVFLRRQARALWGAVPAVGVTTVWFVAGASAWSFCYLVNTNFEYRVVLLLLPAALWLRQADDPVVGRVMRAQLLACLVAFWLIAPKNWWAAGATNGVADADVWFATIFGLEQTLMTMVTMALLISLAGWGWRRWRSEERGE